MATTTESRIWSEHFHTSSYHRHRHHQHHRQIESSCLEEGATALMYACQQENVDQLQVILQRKPATIRERDRTQKTVLHYCVENKTASCAKIILHVAPDIVDIADEDGYTALHLAVIAGNLPLVNFLISKSADINALDAEKHSVVHWATVCGEVELLELLLKCGADPSTPDVHGGYPIHYAAQMCGASTFEIGNNSKSGLTVLRTLLNHNVDVNAVDHDNRQPLLWAASAGSSDATVALINAGTSVHARDKDGLTALHCAASRGHTDCIETLIKLCASDVDVVDNNGCSPLFYSITLGHADATRLLFECGANPNRQDRKGRTPAHCGAAKGQLKTLRIFKKHGGNLWLRNERGDYCLQEAVNSGRKDLVKWLLVQKPDAVNASNADGRCPLHIAAVSNNVEMCKILLDYQSLVNPVMKTNKGESMTPLDAALHKGNRGCAKYLQLHGGVPAGKLTAYSAALRGPHTVDAHSDHQGSLERKLDAPYENRGTRSLDTSPCGYQSQKLQVRIRADLSSSRKFEQAFTTNTTENGCYSETVSHNSKTKCRSKVSKSQPFGDKTNKRYSSSYSDSSSDDEHKCNQMKHRAHGDQRPAKHTRQRRYYKSRTKYKPQEGGSNEEVDQVRIEFNEKTVQMNKTEYKSETHGAQRIVKAQVHREDDATSEKTDEDHKNKVDRIETKEVDKVNESMKKPTLTEEPQLEAPSSTNDGKYEAKTTAVVRSTEESTETDKNGQSVISTDCVKPKTEQQNNVQVNGTETASPRIGHHVQIVERDENGINQEAVCSPSRSSNGTHQISEDTQLDSEQRQSSHKTLDQDRNEERSQLKQRLAEDKGLICVLLDDDETIEIKRKKDQSESSYRTNSANCRKEKCQQKRQRRSRSSFEVLSDEGDDNDDSRFATGPSIHDDSGFEPSPRQCSSKSTIEDVSNRMKSRIPRATVNAYGHHQQSKKTNENDRFLTKDETNINVSSVTQAVQNSLRKYHLERKVFHTLLELKRLQIRAGKSNEHVLVKRLVDDYQKNGLMVNLRPYDGVYSFRHFERYLYEQLRKLQTSSNRKDIPRIKSSDDFERLMQTLKRTRAGKTLLENVPNNPLLCTHSTHRCIHATHAYTGIPCAAYVTKINHHTMPKNCFLPRIDTAKQQSRECKRPAEIAKSLKNVDPSKPVTLELIHGSDKQIISLPTEKLDKNKRYYVTFTIKGANGCAVGADNVSLAEGRESPSPSTTATIVTTVTTPRAETLPLQSSASSKDK